MINIVLKCKKNFTIIFKLSKIPNNFFGFYKCVLTHLFHSDLKIKFVKCNNTLSSLVYEYQFFNKFSKIFFQIPKRCFLTIQTFFFGDSFIQYNHSRIIWTHPSLWAIINWEKRGKPLSPRKIRFDTIMTTFCWIKKSTILGFKFKPSLQKTRKSLTLLRSSMKYL
jgi:hypothetical protein